MTSVVFNMDCMEGMKQYPDKYFDLAVVDPPYGIDINPNMGIKKGQQKRHSKIEWDKSIPDENYFLEIKRVSLNQIVWGGNYMTEHLQPSPCWLLWDKGFSDEVTFAQFEMAWTSFNSSAKKIEFNAAKNTNRIHPTQKPVYLYDWIYKNYLPEGGKVLDTHLGSGSNRIAADKAGNIDFVGYELDKDYFEAQEKRWSNYKAQLTIFA